MRHGPAAELLVQVADWTLNGSARTHIADTSTSCDGRYRRYSSGKAATQQRNEAENSLNAENNAFSFPSPNFSTFSFYS